MNWIHNDIYEARGPEETLKIKCLPDKWSSFFVLDDVHPSATRQHLSFPLTVFMVDSKPSVSFCSRHVSAVSITPTKGGFRSLPQMRRGHCRDHGKPWPTPQRSKKCTAGGVEPNPLSSCHNVLKRSRKVSLLTNSSRETGFFSLRINS